MTLYFDTAAVAALATPELALDAARTGFELEAAGAASLPPRIDVPTTAGFYRCMPAMLGDHMGVKVMTRSDGVGNRYLVLLHEVSTGELLAVFDGEQLTARRTAAVTVLGGQVLCPEPPKSLALIGSGMEASSHVRMMATVWPLERVDVWSRSAENRASFAATHSRELAINVRPAATCAEALGGHDLVVLATKSPEPVLDGAQLRPGAVVLSIGSTRPVLRELDGTTMRRSSVLVVDSAAQVLAESGDIRAGLAAGALVEEQLVALGDLLTGEATLPPPAGGRDLRTFKSAGTALQDLALASALHRVGATSATRDLGELAALKR